jgi:beta-galactosidase
MLHFFDKMNRSMKNLVVAARLLFLFSSLSAQNLFVGANYHPHDDKNPEKIRRDVRLMKEAGFTVVRMGHLAWDSYEPQEGKFDFEWFDDVMDEMHRAGIKVLLDIAVRPAPLWLHKKYPSINVTDANGNVRPPFTRYLEDVGDPNYQKYALRFADEMSKRYGKHPALLAFGIDNEPSSGAISYSETVRQRFIAWLKSKYAATDSLNKAWAGQRWSRKVGNFDEVFLSASGAPERMLDFRRFISDEINGFYFKVIDVVNRNAPQALTNTNAWYYDDRGKYYDYAPMAYSGKMTREGNGFYPGTSLASDEGLKEALFGITRIQLESTTPFWCNEFVTSTAAPKAVRKYAYLSLMYGNQMVCGWTWQAMHGGEEQISFLGMMDWEGQVNRKYDEYKQIAQEFKKIEKYFPYQVNADVALALSFPSQIQSGYFGSKHDSRVGVCFNLFYDRNMDVKIVDLAHSALSYKLLIVAGVSVMDEKSADAIRAFVKRGGTVIMTGGSAILNENGQVFSSALPGYLSDVFGIRISGYGSAKDMNEASRLGYKGEQLAVTYRGKQLDVSCGRHDLIAAKGAEVLGNITNLDKDYPIITSHGYGKGKAIYVGIPADGSILSVLVDELIAELKLKKGFDVPEGIKYRQIDKNHILLFNTTSEPKRVKLNGKSKSILWGKTYGDSFIVEPYEPEFIEL